MQKTNSKRLKKEPTEHDELLRRSNRLRSLRVEVKEKSNSIVDKNLNINKSKKEKKLVDITDAEQSNKENNVKSTRSRSSRRQETKFVKPEAVVEFKLTVNKKVKKYIKNKKQIPAKTKPKKITVNNDQTDFIETSRMLTKRKINGNDNSVLEIPVDRECRELRHRAVVYVENDDIYDVMLNQTNLQFNNNKFYIIQLLKDSDSFYVWMRWARVGKVGQNKLERCENDLDKAKQIFGKKFSDKTGNKWENRCDFQKYGGKYDLVHMDYTKKEENEVDQKRVKLEILECQLHHKIQELLKKILNVQEMDDAVMQMNYDAEKLPLGRLSEKQIKAGYVALREVEGLLNADKNSRAIVQACNDYYTRIPHDFGMRVPPTIHSVSDIKRELELLETLSDIKVALSLMADDMAASNKHRFDRQYEALNCSMFHVDQEQAVHKIVSDYLLLTHGSTHSQYSLELINLFEVRKQDEWDSFVNYDNKMLLWHGSRTSNYGGILGQGLRIAPPEAPVTGHMFGKGVYFADTSSKAANYVCASRAKNRGFLMLCEVSLGKVNELVKADSRANKLPAGFNSVKGCGMIQPDTESWVKLDGDITVPVGVPMDTGLTERHKGYLLNYNEYIVYDKRQIRMRYLVEVNFHYK